MKKIIVGYDSSEQAGDALSWPTPCGHRNRADHCLGRGTEPVFGEIVEWRGTRCLLRSELRRAAKVLGRGDFTRRTSAGSVPGALDQIALAEARRGRGRVDSSGKVGQILPGSVGDRLLAGAPCAVAIAPNGYARSDPSRSPGSGSPMTGRPRHARPSRRRSPWPSITTPNFG